MAANAADIQITASLIDDYLMTEDAPVGPNPNGRFVAVQDPAAATPSTSLLSVDSSGDLVHFYPDTSSHSGWSTTTVQVSAPSGVEGNIARLAAFAQAGTINALAYFPLQSGSGSAATWMQSTEPGSWSQAQLTHDSANALGYTYQTDYYVDGAGNQYLYGITGNVGDGAFFLVWFDPDANAWDVLYEQPLDQFSPTVSTGAAFRLMPGSDGGLAVMWIDGGVIYWRPASITDPGTSNANFAWSGDVASFDPGLQSLSISGIVPLPGTAGQSDLFVIDGSQTLYLIQGYDQPTAAMSAYTGGDDQPAGVMSAVAGVDSTGNLMVLLAETTTQALWILRQSGVDGATPTFDAWVPLGNTVSALSAPPAMAGGPELFLVDPGLNAYHMSQNLTDLVWATKKIAAPTPVSATPTNIAGTSMNLTVVDANQVPVPSALISVESDQPVTLVVSGVSYPAGPGAPAQIQADALGQACVLIETTSLSMPPLTFTVANGDGTTAQRKCQGDQVEVKSGETPVPAAPASVASRLAGDDPNQPLTTTALQNVGLISSSYTDSSGAVAAIKSAGQWMLQNPNTDTNTLSLAHVSVRHWRVEFGKDSSPQFRALSAAEGAAHKQRAEAAVGSFLSKIFGDVANFFKHAWQELESITVTIEDDLTIIFNDIQKFVVTTIREAGQALETIFNRIVQGLTDAYDAIKNAINWLKQLFEWGDILNTHRVIKAAVNSSLNAAVNSITAAEEKVKDKFDTLQSQIETFFQNLESKFEAGQSFNTFANSAGPSPIGGSGNVLAGEPASTAYKQNGPRSNYVHNHVKSYYSGTAGGGAGSVDSILSLIQSNLAGETFDTQTQNVKDAVSSQVSDLHQFFDLVIVDLLKAMEDLSLFVVKGIEDVVLGLLEALEGAIKGLILAWNATIDIPIISWLYKYVLTGTRENPGDDLTVLDALSLLLAVPSTILYKILIGNGSAPFSQADADNLEQNGLPWPQVGDSSTLAASRMALGSSSSSLVTALGMLGGVACFFGTFASMYADGLAFEEDPDSGLKKFVSWSTLITSIVAQGCSAPFGLFANGPSGAADDWTIAFWTVSCLPVGADLIFTFATGGLARFTDTLGPILDTALAAIMIVLAGITIAEQAKDKPPYTGWDQANAIVPQISRFFKFLVLTKDTEAAAVAKPVLLIMDLVLGLGSTVTQIGDAEKG